ncbi:MAG: ADOP family duplicated permease [bacterium]
MKYLHERRDERTPATQAWVDRIRQEIGYAARGLKRSPGFTIAVVLTLGLGIGVNASMFSLLNRLFVQPPAGVQRPNEVRRLYLEFVNGSGSAGRLTSPRIEYPQYRALRAALDPSIVLGIYTAPDSTAVRDGNVRIAVRRSLVNPDYFTVAGVRASAGRLFGRDESDIAVATLVAVVSDAFWRDAFNGDRSILGKQVTIGVQQFTIIGVAQPGFTGLDIDAVDVWLPANTNERSGGGMPGPWYNSFGTSFKTVVRPGTPASEQRLLSVGTNAIRPVEIRGWVYDPTIRLVSGPIVEALGPADRATEVTVATRIAGVAFMVLIIACANVTNLLLLRATRRKREIAVRRALGVTRARLVEQLTVESLLLAVCGGVVALVFSSWAGVALRRLVLPRVHWADGVVDLGTLAFTFGVTLLLGIVAGLLPAIQAMKPDLVESLKAGMQSGAYRGSKLRAALLTVQAALCLVLLVGAGLFIRSLDNVQSIGVGYNAENEIFLRPQFDDPMAHDDEVRAAMPEAVKRLSTVDGVEAVAYSAVGPLQGAMFRTIHLPGHDSTPQLPGDYGPSMAAVSPAFFKASGLVLRAGRDFNDGDQRSTAPVIIVGESMARLYWPGQPAIGKCFMILKRDGPCYVVVGVAADAHRRGLIEAPISQFYVPITQIREVPRVLIVRVRPGSAATVVRTAEQIFRPLVTRMVGMDARTFANVLERELRPWRLGATLFTALGALALVVAAIGVYSVVAYGVSQRIHEMGIRIALGARARDILDLVLSDGLRIVGVGIVIGAVTALALGRLVASLLFGVVPSDPSILIGAIVLMGVVGAVGCLIPGWRAARVDPATALRTD